MSKNLILEHENLNIMTYNIKSNSVDFSKLDAEAAIDRAINYWEEKTGIPFIYIETGKTNLAFEFLSDKKRLICTFSLEKSSNTKLAIEDYDKIHENILFRNLKNKIGSCLQL